MTEQGRIEELVVQELDEANKKYSLFHSPHEAYAVLKEEVDKVEYEVEHMKASMKLLWVEVRKDKNIEKRANEIYKHAIYTAQEAIQVAAMCLKIKKSKLYEEERE